LYFDTINAQQYDKLECCEIVMVVSLKTSGIWWCVGGRVLLDISENCAACIFRIKHSMMGGLLVLEDLNTCDTTCCAQLLHMNIVIHSFLPGQTHWWQLQIRTVVLMFSVNA